MIYCLKDILEQYQSLLEPSLWILFYIAEDEERKRT